jgi:hypothetical protein
VWPSVSHAFFACVKLVGLLVNTVPHWGHFAKILSARGNCCIALGEHNNAFASSQLIHSSVSWLAVLGANAYWVLASGVDLASVFGTQSVCVWDFSETGSMDFTPL